MRHIVLPALALSVTACSPHAFTPSARPMPLSSAEAPARGESDVQLDGNATGEILGPGIFAGNVRYRRGVDERVAVTGDVGILRVDGDSDGQNPHAGMARAGVQVHGPANDDVHAAAFAGVGGGHAPAAGSWASADIGAVFTGTNRVVRPIFLVDLYVSAPFGTRTFSSGDTMLRLPRTIGAQGLVGFDLGPRESAIMLGLAFAKLHSSDTVEQDGRTETFFGLGGGFRFGAI